MDEGAARARGPAFRQRRSARGEQHRDAVARGIDQHIDAVRGADVRVHHHGLRASVDHGDAVGHADSGVFMRHHHRRWRRAIASRSARERLDDRREVSAGVDEQIIDAVRRECFQVVLGGDANGLLLVHGALLRCNS